MRICIDVDGVVCFTRREEEHYSEVKPIPRAVKSIQKLKDDGHYIILHTSRHMKTCEGNIGKIVAKQGRTLLDWLDRHKIPYDEIWFGKPLADVYIDDKAVKFVDWHTIAKEIREMSNS